MINNTDKLKPYINMTTKRPLCKQIIIFIGNENITKFMASSGEYITNINCALKNIELDVFINFICFNYYSFIVTSNKVASSSDLGVVKNYIRNANSMDLNNIQTACFPQSKSYLKILSIFYYIEDNNTLVNLGIIESIIKFTHIFNNINITSKPHVIKVFEIWYSNCID